MIYAEKMRLNVVDGMMKNSPKQKTKITIGILEH
jgi:hypothetical protein